MSALVNETNEASSKLMLEKLAETELAITTRRNEFTANLVQSTAENNEKLKNFLREKQTRLKKYKNYQATAKSRIDTLQAKLTATQTNVKKLDRKEQLKKFGQDLVGELRREVCN